MAGARAAERARAREAGLRGRAAARAAAGRGARARARAPHVPPEAGAAAAQASSTTRTSTSTSAARRSDSSSSAARRRMPATPRSSTSSAPTGQKERWLQPLVAGQIRSFFSMTEPQVPGSDPTTPAHARRARRRRMGDRRAQVVLVGRGRRRVRDRDGGQRPHASPHARATLRSSCPRTRRAVDVVRPINVMGHEGKGCTDALRSAVPRTSACPLRTRSARRARAS